MSEERILLAHGEGGELTRELISALFVAELASRVVGQRRCCASMAMRRCCPRAPSAWP